MTDRRSILGLASAVLGGGALFGAVAARANAAAGDRGLRALSDQFQVREVFAGYVRAVVRRDGPAVQAFYVPGAVIRNFKNQGGEHVPGVPSMRAEQMAEFVNRAYHPYHPGMWGNILHSGEVVRVDGDTATYLAQVTYLSSYTQGADGVPLRVTDLFGEHRAGQVAVTNCGMWEADLKRTPAGWRIAELRIIVDIPYVASA